MLQLLPCMASSGSGFGHAPGPSHGPMLRGHHGCAWRVWWDGLASPCLHAFVCFPSSPCEGGGWAHVWHGRRPMSVLNPARSASQAMVLCDTFTSTGTQQLI
jgi:hypothetical protein